MSSSMKTSSTIRGQLLSTVSALTLLGSAYAADAAGNDAARPLIWIDLGGQMENITGQGEIFAPTFLSVYPSSPVLNSTTPLQAQKPPTFSFGEEGSISFQPERSDWVFSAGIRIGRSNNQRNVDHQTSKIHYQKYAGGVGYGKIFTQADFANTKVHHQESHAILDFSAGKDVGLGMFGKDSSSVLSLGVRFAQFASKTTFDIRARPDLHFKYLPSASSPSRIPIPYFHTYHATGQASRSFRGVGPSLSWSGSTPFVGNPQDGEITLDWGANASLLFGKQKARARHQETAHYVSKFAFFHSSPPPPYTVVYQRSHDTNRSVSVTVPNVGGSIGLSWHVQDFKVSLGYRADFFFGAMDGGIDVRKSETLGFKGPYASISIGLGN